MATEQYTLKDYLGALRRRSALFMGIFAVVTATAVAFAFLRPDEYRASAEMRIDMQGPNDMRMMRREPEQHLRFGPKLL